MDTLVASIPCDDQPIGNRLAGTMMHEPRYLTSWVSPKSLGVQEQYKRLTSHIPAWKDRIVACWDYVKRIPYREYVPTRVSIGNVSFAQNDTWLDVDFTLKAPYLNCFNKAILLASLMRQELDPADVYVCLGNVQSDGIGGHAFVFLATGDYIMECTNPHLRLPFIMAEDADIYESVIFFNDQYVNCVPDKSLVLPIGNCCVKWLEDYISARFCHNYIV